MGDWLPSDRSRRPGEPAGRARGQTTLDFAFGIGVFLLVVAFVFLFVPSMLDPVAGGEQEDRVVADRIATQLATGMLVSTPANPYTLDRPCTRFFFNERTDPGDCRFASGSLKARVGITDLLSMRVQLTRSGSTLLSVSDPPGATPPSSGTSTVFVARRAVQYEGNLETLTVEVW